MKKDFINSLIENDDKEYFKISSNPTSRTLLNESPEER